jgi:Tol biopolymer transport system component
VTAQVDEISARVTVNVTEPIVEEIVISPSDFAIELGETKQMTAVLKDKFGKVIEGRSVLWTTINESVRIHQSGVVIGTQPGEVIIIATSEGVSSVVTGEVTAPALAWDLIYDRASFTGMSELYILNPTTGEAPTPLSAGTAARSPSASPDGSRVAFAFSVEEYGTGQKTDDIFVVNRDGMHMTRLTSAPGVEEAPAWSPLGDRIAYQHWEGNGRSDIWVMDPDGGNQVNLTADMMFGPFRSSAAWTRDGQKIAFVESRTEHNGKWTSIWVMRSDGSEKRQLTSSLTASYSAPTWSHDGTRLAFVRTYTDDTDITVVDVESGTATRITIPGLESHPSWSPDGSVIAFTSGGSVYTVRPDGSKLRLRTLDPEWGAAGAATWILRR